MNKNTKKQAEIFYLVHGSLYRNDIHTDDDSDDDVFDIKREFRGANVLEIREKAFNYFQSLLEVMLESKGLVYKSDEQAQEDLKDFYFTGIQDVSPKMLTRSKFAHLQDMGITVERDADKYLEILFCQTSEVPYVTKSGMECYEGFKTIRYFGYKHEDKKQEIVKNLKEEQKYLNK